MAAGTRVDPPKNPGDYGIHPIHGLAAVPPVRVSVSVAPITPEVVKLTPAMHSVKVNPDGTFSTKGPAIFYGVISGTVQFVGHLVNGVWVECT